MLSTGWSFDGSGRWYEKYSIDLMLIASLVVWISICLINVVMINENTNMQHSTFQTTNKQTIHKTGIISFDFQLLPSQFSSWNFWIYFKYVVSVYSTYLYDIWWPVGNGNNFIFHRKFIWFGNSRDPPLHVYTSLCGIRILHF